MGDYDNHGHVRILTAAEKGDLAEVRRLLAGGAEPDVPDILSGYTALYAAAHRGDFAMVKMLAEAGADPNRRDNDVRESPIEIAAEMGHKHVVSYLQAISGHSPA